MKNYYNSMRTSCFSNWKFTIGIVIFMLTSILSNAQVTTNGGSGLAATYPDLATAITALNAATISSPVVITLAGAETAPAGGYAITATGTAANTIIIEGSTSTITAPTPQASGVLTDAIFKLIGADFVTIRNFTMQENAANTTTTSATNNMTEWGVALLYATTTNGAQNNTISGNTISLSRTYQNTFGIYANSTHSATTATTSATATTVAGGNSGLKIYSNAISNVNNGIVVVGPTAIADNNTGIDIGGTSLTTANTITNFGITGAFSSFANVSGSINGILVRNSIGFNISFNTITSFNGTTAGVLNGIQIPAATNAPTGLTFTNTINNNIVSLRSGANAVINGINFLSGSASALSTVTVNNNDFNNFAHTGTSPSSAVNFIVTVGADLNRNINSNTFSNITLSTTGSVLFISNSVTRPANSVCNVNNNAIVGAFSKTGAGGTITFYNSNGSTSTSGTENNLNNNFSNITVTGATTIAGWGSTDGSGTLPFGPGKNVSNNTFSNITGGTNGISILNVGFSNDALATNNVENNLISNVTGGGAITGLISNGGRQNFFNNTIHTLTSTGAATVSAISIGGGSTQNIHKNKIYNIEANNAAGFVNGVLVSAGTTINLYNDVIGDLRTPATNAANPLNGINITGGTTANIYNNTVYLNGASTGALFGSSAISVSTTPVVNLRNNIFINKSATTGAGLAVAYRRSTTTLTSYAATSNNNIFFGSSIFTDGTNTDATLAAYLARVTPSDVLSQTEDTSAFFQSTTGSDANFLRIPIGTTSFAESGAVLITTPNINVDYWNVTRPFPSPTNGGVASDIGASEFDGIPLGTQCVAPIDQATALVTGVTTTTTTAGSFTAAASATTGYLVVASNGALSVNPADGSTYVPGAILGNGIVLQQGTAVTYTGSGLTANTAYTITVFSYNSTACIGGPKYLISSPLTGSITTCPLAPTALVFSTITSSGFTVAWTAPAGGTAGTINYTMDVATDAAFTALVASSPISVGTPTTQVITGLTDATNYFVRIKANNGTCDSAFLSGTVTTLCIPASFTTTNGTRCGTGTVNLLATPSAGNIAWYAAATGGSPLFTGNTFTTSTISATTQYFAESQIPGPIVAGARVAPTNIANTTPSSYGLVFDVTSGFTLNSVDLFNGTTTAGTCVIQLQSNTGAVLQTSTTFNLPAGTGVIGTTIPFTANLGWTIPVGTGYRILVTSGTASLVRESGLGGFPYAIGAVGSITSGYISGVSTTYYYLYNWQIQTNCISASRTAVTATVTPATAITPSANVAICNGSSTTLTVSSANDPNYTYTWSPATGLSATTGASVTANPTATTTYTITANDTVSGCATTATVTVTVNVAPTAITVAPATAIICPNAIQTLTATGGSVNVTGTIGTGTALTTATGEQTAFCNRRINYWSQTIYTAAELTAAGFSAGNITSMAYEIASLGDAATNANFTVRIGTTALSAFPTTAYAATTGFTTVYGPSTYTHTASGWQTITFVTPYVWDGTSNIIINVTHDGIDSINNSQTYYTVTPDNKSLYNFDTPTVGILSVNRLNLRLVGSTAAAITWAPTSGLYTDAAATVAYTGTNASTVYAKLTASETYTATATIGTCTSSNTSALTVTSINNGANEALGTITATQAGATYQWFTCPNSILSGETNQTFTPTVVGDYKVVVTLAGCSAESACITVSTLSTSKFENALGFKAYPNPTTNILNVEYTSEITKISVANMLGQQVMVKNVSETNTQVDMSGLNAGMYLVTVEAGNVSKTIKVVKK